MPKITERTLPKESPFRGLSATPDAPEPERLSVCENLFRDYAAGAGGALSTVPGFRAVATLSGAIHGVYAHGGALLVHAGTGLYRVTGENTVTALTATLADAPSRAFTFAGRFYILDGAGFQVLSGDELSPVQVAPPVTEEAGEAVAAPSLLTTAVRRVYNVTEGTEPAVTRRMLYAGAPLTFTGPDTFVRAPLFSGQVDLGAYRGGVADFVTVDEGTVTDTGSGAWPRTLLLRAETGDLTLTPSLASLASPSSVCFDAAGEHRISMAAMPYFARSAPPDLHFSCPISGLSDVFTEPNNLCYLPPSVSIAPGTVCRTGIAAHLTGRLAVLYAGTVLPEEGVPPVVEARASAGHSSGRIGLYEDDGELVLEAGADMAETGTACILFAARLETEPGAYRDFFFNVAVRATPVATATYRFGSVCRPRCYPAKGQLLSASTGAGPVPCGVVTDAMGEPLYAVAGCGDAGQVTLTFEEPETPAELSGRDTVFAGWSGTLPRYRRALPDGCRYGAVLGDRLLLGGNPACPCLLFYSEPDAADFRLFSVFSAPDAVTGLFAAGDALYVLTAAGVHRYRKGAGTGLVSAVFTHAGNTALHPVGQPLVFGGEVLLPAREGVFGFRPSAADPLETLYPRGDAIAPELAAAGTVEGAAVFEGYAALFCRGRVLLADGHTARAGGNSRWQYDWYPLAEVGVRYQKTGGTLYRTGRYRTLPEPPSSLAGKTLTAAGLPVLWQGEATVAASAVLTGTLSADGAAVGTALYTPVDGGCLLCDGPLEYDDAGDFYPAVCPLALSAAAGADTTFFGTSASELLFFGDAAGHLYLVNTDKRAADGSLSPAWYSFDGHRIKARLLTGRDDGGKPADAKSVRPGSLTVLTRAMGGPAPRLFLLTDRGGVFRAVAGDAGFGFDGLSFDGPGFAGDTVRRLTFATAPRRCGALRFALSDGGFCAPFGLYSIHYGYTVAGRIKS